MLQTNRNNLHEDAVYWRVTLNNGQTYYQDDSDETSWTQLKEFCKQNNLKIKDFRVIFRDHEITTHNGKAYFFRNGMAAQAFGGDAQWQQVIIGYLNGNGNVYTETYNSPALTLMTTQVRNLESCLDSLINAEETN